MRKNNLIAIFLLSAILLPVLLGNVNPVSASEEEEFDGFNQMPNYRWVNETTTSGVTEQLIGDQYESYAYNNETSGSSNLEKSRLLNSRDFHFDTRFGLDIGGNETEYFRDILGDACDFNEGDTEGFVAVGATSPTVTDGILTFIPVSDYTGVGIAITDDQSVELLEKIVVRAKTSIEATMLFSLYTNVVNAVESDSKVFTTEWDTYEFTFSNFNYNVYGNTVSLTSYPTNDDYPFTVWVDSIEIINSLDYASHVEGEIEDTWDWGDSTEYWYDEYGNVSDFNDGTTENYTAGFLTDNIAVSAGWLNINAVSSDFHIGINCTNQAIVTGGYDWLTFEFNSTDNLADLTVYDDDSNEVYSSGAGIYSADTLYLFSIDLGSDGDWTGTETGYSIKFTAGNVGTWSVMMNFTYLYDCELGDLEGWDELAGLGYIQHVNPEGYMSIKIKEGVTTVAIRDTAIYNIPTGNFDVIKTRISAGNDIDIRIKGKDPDGVIVDLSDWVEITTRDFVEYTFDLSLDNDWTANFQQIMLVVQDDSGTFEGDERINVDCFLLTGHYSETDGFKFSLLNQKHEEGMYFQFTREQDSDEYTLDINMLDSSGIALDYSIAFNYSMVDDGFLRLDVDWHLDKKEIKIKFSYENLTKIINSRTITDLYPYLGSGQLKLLEDGFPSLCINNSIGPIACSLVIIDYIDADWKILDWKESAENLVISEFSETIIQSDDDKFDSVSPYGMVIAEEEAVLEKWYWIDIDRFDGLTFSVKGEAIIDAGGDAGTFYFRAHNVHDDGTLERYCSVKLTLSSIGNGYIINNNTGTLDSDSVGDGANFTASFSLYYESSTKMILQFMHEGGSLDVTRTYTFAPVSDDVSFTKEMVFEFAYVGITSYGGGSGDFLSFSVSGFDPVRKDLLGDIVAAIINPVFGLFETFILAPLLALLGLLGKLLNGGFQFVVDLLSPLLEAIIGALGTVLAGIMEIGGNIVSAIGDIADDVATAVWSGIEGTLEFITDAIALIVTELVTLIGETLEDWVGIIVPVLAGLAEDVADIVFNVIGFLITLLIAGIDIIVDLIAATIFFIWDSFWETVLGYDTAPDLIAIAMLSFDLFVDVIIGAPDFLSDLITLIFSLGMFIALGMFAYNWIVPAFEGSFGGWVEKFVEIALKDVTGEISILGFAVPIPFVLVWVSLLSLNAAGLIPSGF